MEIEAQNPHFWKDKGRAIKVNQDLNLLREEVTGIESLKKEIEQLKSEDKIEGLEDRINEKETEIFLSGKYDKNGAIVSIFSGAGGQDAQDWTTLLLRMYERYCQKRGFKTKVLHQSFGEAGGPEGRIGTKSVTLEVKGNLAFGILKKENGVHRLVRISPFSQKDIRHTSFALVEIIPQIPELERSEIGIKPEDLKVDFYRASGPGGQYVNRRETAIRITHLPTKTVVLCQSERSQLQNRKKAMELLYSKLYQLSEKSHQKEILKIKGQKVSASWGNQIRSYVLHPYKLVKDLRI